jgi:hypothetical protein
VTRDPVDGGARAASDPITTIIETTSSHHAANVQFRDIYLIRPCTGTPVQVLVRPVPRVVVWYHATPPRRGLRLQRERENAVKRLWDCISRPAASSQLSDLEIENLLDVGSLQDFDFDVPRTTL